MEAAGATLPPSNALSGDGDASALTLRAPGPPLPWDRRPLHQRSWTMWIHSRFTKAKRPFLGTKLALEMLEDRLAPAAFTVTTTADVLNATDGKVSLREAISKANMNAGADTIIVQAGVYRITMADTSNNVNLSGDIDITDAVTIKGAGRRATFFDAQTLDRVFEIIGTGPSSIQVTLRDLTIRNGSASDSGGGVLVG